MPLTEAPASTSKTAAHASAPLSSGSTSSATTKSNKSNNSHSKSAQSLRPSYPSSRRDSNILLDTRTSVSTGKTRSLTGTQPSSVSSSPPLAGTDHEDDEHDENDRASNNAASNNNNNNNSNRSSSNNNSKSDATARPHYKEGIRLAEMGKWGTLVVRLQKEPQLARHKDHHGMLPLHWACTEDDVPPSVIQALLKAFPEAVLTKNNAQYLPIHIAVRARVGKETLHLLCQARPSSLLETTPSGKTALLLAQEVSLAPESMDVLQAAERAYRDLTEERESSSNAYEDTKREIAVQSQRLRESMLFPGNQPSRQSQQLRQSSALGLTSSGSNSQRGVGSTRGRNTTTVSTSAAGTTYITIANGQSNTSAAPSTAPLAMTTSSSLSGNAYRPSRSSAHNTSSYTSDYYSEQLPTLEQFQFNTAPVRLTTTDDRDTEHRRSSRGVYEQTQQQVQHMQQTHQETHEHPSQRSHTQTPLTPSLSSDAEGNSGVCGVCYKKFSMFRKKYQCKGCAVYLCKKHVAGKVVFPAYGKKRSACGDCYRIYRSDPMPLSGAAPGTAPAALGGRTASFTSSNTTGTTVTTARAANASGLDRNSSLRNTTTSSVGSSVQHTRTSRAASTQSLAGRTSSVAGPQANARYSVNAAAARPRLGTTSMYSARSSSTADRFGSDTMMSLSEHHDPHAAAAEIAVLQQRISGLEDQNKTLLTRLADQEKQYNEAMLLLTETMTRVAELEIKVPSSMKHTFGTSTTSENRESNILGDYDFDFPTPFNEKFD